MAEGTVLEKNSCCSIEENEIDVNPNFSGDGIQKHLTFILFQRIVT